MTLCLGLLILTTAVSLVHLGELEVPFDLGHAGLHMSWASVKANEAFDNVVCPWHMVRCEGQVNLFLHHDL